MSNLGIQKGSIQVKINDYYTATCRDIRDLQRMLNDNTEEKKGLAILSVYNVSDQFENAVKDMINIYKETGTTEKKVKLNERVIKNVKMSYNDTMFKTFEMDVVVRQDNKIKLLFDTMGDWKRCFQTIKSTGKGDYMTLYGNRVYFYWDAPSYNK